MGSYPGVLSQSVHSRLDQVVCFARDLEVFILKVVRGVSGNEKRVGRPTLFGHSFLHTRVVQIEVKVFRVLSAGRLTIEGVAIRLCSQSCKGAKDGHPV